jgi:triosephosphate isomerase
MARAVKPLIAGNWKMNGLTAALGEVERLGALLKDAPAREDSDVAICPPATLLRAMSAKASVLGIATGGQDCHAEASGAHTGDVSAEMLKDAGAAYVIVGHSERRADHGETDAMVRAKAGAAIRAGLTPIICVGETRTEREAGAAEAVVERQLAGSVPDGDAEIVIAYEPVWAIGTGLTPTSEDIAAMHATIRLLLVARLGGRGEGTRILYGGSLKPGNAGEILAIENVDGGLIGGASLLANDLYAIISAL